MSFATLNDVKNKKRTAVIISFCCRIRNNYVIKRSVVINTQIIINERIFERFVISVNVVLIFDNTEFCFCITRDSHSACAKKKKLIVSIIHRIMIVNEKKQNKWCAYWSNERFDFYISVIIFECYVRAIWFFRHF